jgi:hypothetical protein
MEERDIFISSNFKGNDSHINICKSYDIDQNIVQNTYFGGFHFSVDEMEVFGISKLDWTY